MTGTTVGRNAHHLIAYLHRSHVSGDSHGKDKKNYISTVLPSQLQLEVATNGLPVHHTGQYGHQYGDCNSYESDSQSAKCNSRLARVTNKRSTRKTSLVTVTVLNERTKLSKDQLMSPIIKGYSETYDTAMG
jgi:hypothetical protein